MYLFFLQALGMKVQFPHDLDQTFYHSSGVTGVKYASDRSGTAVLECPPTTRSTRSFFHRLSSIVLLSTTCARQTMNEYPSRPHSLPTFSFLHFFSLWATMISLAAAMRHQYALSTPLSVLSIIFIDIFAKFLYVRRNDGAYTQTPLSSRDSDVSEQRPRLSKVASLIQRVFFSPSLFSLACVFDSPLSALALVEPLSIKCRLSPTPLVYPTFSVPSSLLKALSFLCYSWTTIHSHSSCLRVSSSGTANAARRTSSRSTSTGTVENISRAATRANRTAIYGQSDASK